VKGKIFNAQEIISKKNIKIIDNSHCGHPHIVYLYEDMVPCSSYEKETYLTQYKKSGNSIKAELRELCFNDEGSFFEVIYQNGGYSFKTKRGAEEFIFKKLNELKMRLQNNER